LNEKMNIGSLTKTPMGVGRIERYDPEYPIFDNGMKMTTPRYFVSGKDFGGWFSVDECDFDIMPKIGKTK